MVASIVAGAATIAAAAALAGHGDGGGGSARVAWEGQTRVFTPKMLPRDRILAGRLRNVSLRGVELMAADVRLLDADGRPLRSTARFLATFVHGRYPPLQRPKTPNRTEQRQLGELAVLRPNESTPVTLSWRLAPGGKPPVRVELASDESLPLP